MKLFASAAAAALLFAIAGQAGAATITIAASTDVSSQVKNAPTYQAAAANAATFGGIGGTLDNAAINGINLNSSDVTVNGIDASASLSASVSASASGSGYNNGASAASEAASGAVGPTFFTPAANFAWAENESSNWQIGNSWSAGLNGTLNMSLPSVASATSTLSNSQLITDVTQQTASANEGSGAIAVGASVNNTAANLANQHSTTVHVNLGGCGC